MNSVPGSFREQILQKVKTFSGSNLFLSVCGLLFGYFTARLLGPSQYGLVLTAQILFDYAVMLHLGLLYALPRDVPLALGAGDSQKVSQTEQVGFLFSLAVAVPAALAFFGLSFWVEDPRMRWILWVFAVALFLDFPLSFYTARMKGHSSFEELAGVQRMTAYSYLLSIGLVFLFGLKGFLAGCLIRQGVSLLACLFRSDFRPALLWSTPRFLGMLSYGIPILLMVLTEQLMASVDRLITLRFYGPEAMAFFNLGRMYAGPILMALIAAYTVLAPQYSLTYGKTARIQDLERFVLVPFRSVSIFSALSAGALILAIPALTESLLPQFRAGIVPAQILIFGLVIGAAISNGVSPLLCASDRQWLYLAVLAVGAIVKLGISWALAYQGLGIQAIAWGALAAHLLLAAALYGVGLRLCGRRMTEIARGLLEFFAPFAYVLLCCLALMQISGALFGSVSSWKSVFFQEIFFLLGTSFFLVRLLKELRVIKD